MSNIILNNPEVSVIIPTYNRAGFIAQAIDSVLSQTYKDYEIIVVDDGSSDNTKEVLIPYGEKIRYIHQTNSGASTARNTGIINSRGKYIAFLDSDDLFVTKKLEKQVKILDEHDDIAMVYSNIYYCDHSGKITSVAFKKKMFQTGYIPAKVLLRKAMCGHLQTWLIKKSCFEEIGYIDTSLKMSEDRDMSLRVAMKYKIFGIKEPLTIVRQHEPTLRLGRSPAKEREFYYFKMLEKLFSENNGPIIEKNKKRVIADYYSLAGKNYLRERDASSARKRFALSIRYNPVQVNSYFYLIGTLAGSRGLKFIINFKKLLLKAINK